MDEVTEKIDGLSNAFSDLAKNLREAADGLKEAIASLPGMLPQRKVVVKGADIKPDVYGGYLQKKKRRHKK